MSPKHRTFSTYDPMEYKSMAVAKKLKWQRMLLFDNDPHVLAKVNGKEVMLMLDLGAAGTSFMFQIQQCHDSVRRASQSCILLGINSHYPVFDAYFSISDG